MVEHNKDMVKEAQDIINEYINKKRLEKLNLQYKVYSKLVDDEKKHNKKRKTKHLSISLNYIIIILSVIFLNLLIYKFTR